MKQEKLLSIVILVWNGEEVIEKNLKSLMSDFDRERGELIVVDNHSEDCSLNILSKHSDIKLVKNSSNLGFTEGNNIGMRRAAGKYILLLNQDVEQIDGAIQKIIDFLERNPEYGAVAPQLLYPSGKIQKSCRPFYNWKNLFIDYLTFGWYRKNFYDHTKSQDVDQPMASVLMIRKSVLDSVGYFDEHRDFWLYFSDVDLSWRIAKAGFRHYLLTEAKFYHHHGESTRKFLSFKRLLEYHRGLYRFFMKYHVKRKASFKYLALLFIIAVSYIFMSIRESINSFGRYSSLGYSCTKRHKVDKSPK